MGIWRAKDEIPWFFLWPSPQVCPFLWDVDVVLLLVLNLLCWIHWIYWGGQSIKQVVDADALPRAATVNKLHYLPPVKYRQKKHAAQHTFLSLPAASQNPHALWRLVPATRWDVDAVISPQKVWGWEGKGGRRMQASKQGAWQLECTWGQIQTQDFTGSKVIFVWISGQAFSKGEYIVGVDPEDAGENLFMSQHDSNTKNKRK